MLSCRVKLYLFLIPQIITSPSGVGAISFKPMQMFAAPFVT